MGRAKQAWMESQEEEAFEKKAEYIREQLGNPHANESTDGWNRYADEYELTYGDIDYLTDWEVHGKSRLELLMSNLDSCEAMLYAPLSPEHDRRRLVMLYGHVVATVEGYLSSTFLQFALSSDKRIRLFLQYDDVLAKGKFSLREIYLQHGGLRGYLAHYVKTGITFHSVEKVQAIYSKVLGVEFEEIGWLAKAVKLRHHCVHRAGYDADGSPVKLTSGEVSKLIERVRNFASIIDERVLAQFSEDIEPPF